MERIYYIFEDVGDVDWGMIMVVERLLIDEDIGNVKCLGNVEFVYVIVVEDWNCDNGVKDCLGGIE